MFQTGADPTRLRAHVTALEGERHRLTSPERLAAAGEYIADRLGISFRRPAATTP